MRTLDARTVAGLDLAVSPAELAEDPRGGRGVRLVRGRPDDPAWVRPALLALLAGTALLYLVGLSASGYANSFYSGAVQAATKSWRAFFFGSSDAANFISVDKPPAALWVMDLSARVFGLSSWSILAPQAAEGVACVALLYVTVRRTFSAGIALFAGLLMALTPAATVMFRFNNPDPLLVLVLIASAYCLQRSVEHGETSWLMLAGTFVGVGFMTKMLQAFLVVPALGTVYLVSGPPRLRRRMGQLVLAGLAMAVSAGWWVAAVQLTPVTDRPYVGGSQDNSLLNLIFGYNGLGRLNGSESGSVGFRGPSSSGGGGAGVFRLFNGEFGVYIAWLLPAAVIGLGIGLYATRRSSRTNPRRAALLLWGGWLFVTGAAFSLGQGIIHPYYSIALAPPVAVLAAVGVGLLWAGRMQRRCRWALAGVVAATLACADLLLSQAAAFSASGQAAMGLAIVVVGTTLILGPALRRRVRRVSTAVAVVACLAGPLSSSVAAAMTAEHSAIPTVGAAKAAPTTGTHLGRQHVAWSNWLLRGLIPPPALTAVLADAPASCTWVAAAAGSERAASYQLATGRPVMAIGGFNGTDPIPTLSLFRDDVAEGKVGFFIDGAPGSWLGGSDATQVATWVETRFRERTVAGFRIYALAEPVGTQPASTS